MGGRGSRVVLCISDGLPLVNAMIASEKNTLRAFCVSILLEEARREL